tara:strand:- start:196 stop:966 length:771 start_codon:yes stop_codon:yes gene_type:complete
MLKNKFLLFFCIVSPSFAFDFQSAIDQAFKDSVDYNSIDLQLLEQDYEYNSDFLFFKALIERNGESAFKSYKKLYSKFPKYKYADYAISEVGSYYYSKGYYIKSSDWYKKIPMYYHDSKLIKESIDMFYNTLIISGSMDSVGYYKNIFSKLYPNLNVDAPLLDFLDIPNETKVNKNNYNEQYTIQLGVFKDYNGAQIRLNTLRNAGFSSVRIMEDKKEGEILYVVKEGKYSTKKSAEKVSLRIKARTGLNSIIIKL